MTSAKKTRESTGASSGEKSGEESGARSDPGEAKAETKATKATKATKTKATKAKATKAGKAGPKATKAGKAGPKAKGIPEEKPPGFRKSPEELLDPARALERQWSATKRTLDAARQKEPWREWADMPDSPRGGPMGAEIPEDIWAFILEAPIRSIETFITGQSRLEDFIKRVPDKRIRDAAKAWARYSRHFGLRASTADLAGAIVGSASTLGSAIARAVLFVLFRDEFPDARTGEGET